MHIRYEQADDADKIRHVLLAAFETDAEANLVDALHGTGVELISLLAEQDGDVIGHILFSPVTIDGNISIAGLAPMAVTPKWQNKGIGTALVNEGINACIQSGYQAVVVLGHPHYYPRFGFVPSESFGIQCEYDVPAEVFMIKELQKGALKGISGTIRYHQVFNDF